MPTFYLNGDYVPREQALIPVEDRGFIFGDGIYEGASADDGGAGGRVNGVGAEVGNAGGIGADVSARQLELAAADISEVLAIRAGGSFFVEKDGDAQFGADFGAELAGEGDAVVHCGPFERNEGADVGGADAGVFALVGGEVDQVAGLGDAVEGGLHRAVGGRHEGDDGAVMAGIARRIEDDHALDARDGGDDGGDDLGATPLGEVRNAFDEFHDRGRFRRGVC